MYQIEGSRAVLHSRSAVLARRLPRVSRNVVLLGLVSLFTDVSSEMVATVLPLYLVYSLGFSPFAYGVVDGAYQGAVGFVRLAGGFVADRLGRYKATAALGYGLSAATRPLLLVAGSTVPGLTALLVADRAGKGIRTAPRDALISLSSEPRDLATAFGVHRALDTAGAMLGPLIAFAILFIAPLSFDSIFVVSFCFAVLGFTILVLFVREHRPRPGAVAVEENEPVSVRAAIRLLRLPRFRVLVGAGAGIAFTTVSDSFVYISLRERLDFDIRYLPLLFVGTALVFMAAAIPLGRLADRLGRGTVFLGGQALLLALYASLLAPAFGNVQAFVVVAVFGIYYAATDGVLMALASAVLPAHLRASGLATLVTATTTGRLGASLIFGSLWTWFSLETALTVFTCGLAGATALAGIALRRVPAPRAG